MKLVGTVVIASALLIAAGGAHAEKPCANQTGEARTRCLRAELATGQSIAQDRTDALKAYDRAYNAAAAASAVAKTASGRAVPGGSAVYSAGQAAGNAIVNRDRR